MLRRHFLSPFFQLLARSTRLRRRVTDWVTHHEGGSMYSATLRQILAEHCRVQIGKYSYGPCLSPGSLPRGTCVGNYCSFAGNIRVFRRNHPVERVSQHPAFYNHRLGFLAKDSIQTDEENPLIVGNDVWIGQNVIIAPKCRSIGDGAIIAAGAIVSGDVPPFAIVGGIPAKLIKWRFNEDLQRELLELRWWDHDLEELTRIMPLFTQTLTPELVQELRSALQASVK